MRLGVDGHRGELTITRAARALAAFEGRKKITAGDVRRVAPMCLRHRLRRDPLEMVEGGARIEQAVEDIFGEDPEGPDEGRARRGDGSDYPTPDTFDHTGDAPRQHAPPEKNRGHERGFRQADTDSDHHDPHQPSDREALDAASATEERVVPSATCGATGRRARLASSEHGAGQQWPLPRTQKRGTETHLARAARALRRGHRRQNSRRPRRG